MAGAASPSLAPREAALWGSRVGTLPAAAALVRPPQRSLQSHTSGTKSPALPHNRRPSWGAAAPRRPKVRERPERAQTPAPHPAARRRAPRPLRAWGSRVRVPLRGSPRPLPRRPEAPGGGGGGRGAAGIGAALGVLQGAKINPRRIRFPTEITRDRPWKCELRKRSGRERRGGEAVVKNAVPGLPPPPGKGPAAAPPSSPLQLCDSARGVPPAVAWTFSPSPFPPGVVTPNNPPPLVIRL